MTEMDVDVIDVGMYHSILKNIAENISVNHLDKLENGEQINELTSLVKRSVQTNECNSVIITGPNGSGKTTIIENILKTLTKDCVITNETALIVRLHGLLHVDKNITLKDIAKQLKRMSMYNKQTSKSASFQDCLTTILNSSHGLQPCVIFVLEEFHVFCQHKNQVLLYNLFDICQSGKVPVCILGVTSQVDVTNLMEKRVLSRFSQRVIQINHSLTLKSRLELFQKFMLLTDPSIEELFVFLWNERVKDLSTCQEVIDMMQQQMTIDNSYLKFKNDCFSVLLTIQLNEPLLKIENIKKVVNPTDSMSAVLKNLTLLEMSLIIAIKFYMKNYQREPFNFEMIYVQFLKFIKKSSTSVISDKTVLLRVFQRLEVLDLILPVKKVRSKALMEYDLYNCNLTDDQIKDAVTKNRYLTTELKQLALGENI